MCGGWGGGETVIPSRPLLRFYKEVLVLLGLLHHGTRWEPGSAGG